MLHMLLVYRPVQRLGNVSIVRGNDPLLIGIALLINSITIAILAFSDGGAAVNVPVTVLVVFINVMAMIGLNSNIDDASAVLADLSEEEKKLHRYQNWIKAPFIMYRALIILGFGGSMLAQLWSMYLA